MIVRLQTLEFISLNDQSNFRPKNLRREYMFRWKKWFSFGLIFLICTFGLFTFANIKVIPWLYKINFYYSSHHETFSDAYLKRISENDRALLKKHVSFALSSLNEKNEHEIAAAINDYLFQFLLSIPHWGEPAQVLEDEEAICGVHAHVMSAMLSDCGIENRIAYMLDVPYQNSHCLVEVHFKDGSMGLFDPMHGLYWFDQEKNTHLSMNNLKNQPSLASTKILKTIHAKRKSKHDSVSPFISAANHYQPFTDDHELHFEEMFSTYSNAGVEGNSFKIFQRISFKDDFTVLGDRSSKNMKGALSSLCLEKGENAGPICCIHQLGKSSGGQHLNVAHIYELNQLKKNQPYTLTLHYFKSINSVLSSTILGGKFAAKTKSTQHDVIEDFGPKLWQTIPAKLPGKSRTISINFVPDESKVNIVVDNSGEMLLHAIAIEPTK